MQEQVIVQEIPRVFVVERIQEQIVEPIEVLPQERVQQHSAIQITHVPVPQIQEQSAVTGLVNTQFPITAVEAEEFAALAEATTLNTSSTSTSSSSTSTISDDVAKMLHHLQYIEEATERVTMLTKRMMEPPMVEPPLVESDRASAKHRRRTRYTPLPGIMENAVYLAPSAWPPVRHVLTSSV